MGEGWFLLSLKEAALVTLKTQTGGYLAIYGTERIGAFRAENLTLTAYLDTEPVLVYWKPQPGTRELFLEARVPAEFPTAQVPCFLGSGEEAVYRFTVTEETAVGITARAEREVLEISLFDRSFRMIASGPVIYRTLPPGEYVAVMRGSDAPVRYVPLIYGNDGSKRDVPDEIKKGYREE